MLARRFLLAAAGATLAGNASGQSSATIQGTAAYRERIALPPGTVLEVVLEDFARADAPAERISAARIPVEGQVPIAFSLPYNPARIDPRGRYALRATLSHEGRVLFRTGSIHPVPAGEATGPVALRLVQAREPAEPSAAGPAAALVGPRWAVEDVPGAAEAHLVFTADGAVYGSGGCNRLRGGYRTSGADGIELGPLATTMMACPSPADEAERRVLDALGAARRWRVEGGLLVLMDGGGAPLLRLRGA